MADIDKDDVMRSMSVSVYMSENMHKQMKQIAANGGKSGIKFENQLWGRAYSEAVKRFIAAEWREPHGTP